MCHAIENSSSFEICAVICFVYAKNVTATEIHRELCTVHSQTAMNLETVRQQCSEIEKQTPWPESASELYRPSYRRLSAKLVPTFCGYRVPRGQRDIPMAVFSDF
jgi:hypothetical protein